MSDAARGGDFYQDDRVREAYLRHRHGGAVSPNVVMEEPAVLALLGSLEGARVLDLGCGDGSTAPLVLAAGATEYVGVDGSGGMVSQATATFGSDVVRFVESDLEDLDSGLLDEHEFDVVMSRMALHYVRDLGPTLVAVDALLRSGGRFVFSVVHPVVTSFDASGDGPRTTWTVDDYFVRGGRPRSWFESTVTWHHRTIEDYVGLMVGHGFAIDGLSECEPQADLLVDDPAELERRRRVPLMLALSGTRGVRA